jgi:hypothetical protein
MRDITMVPVAERNRAPNLVHDTVYRRSRAAIARCAHRIDAAVAAVSQVRYRILFEAGTPMGLAVFQPVLRVLQKDHRLEFWFCSRCQGLTSPSITNHSDRVIEAEQASWMKFDAYVNTDFWGMTWLRRKTRRVHFFHGVAGKYDLDAPVELAPLIGSFDRLMFVNEDRLQRYAEAGLVDPESPQAALIGYPKVDCLVDGTLDRSETEALLGIVPDVPTVLYAPTWSPYSSLNLMGLDVVSALARLDLNVVVKLHDRSLDGSQRGSGGIDWRAAFADICRTSRVRFAEGADASPLLHAADVLVSDHSSVGFEFTLLDRPIVLIDCPQLLQKARVNPHKVELLRSAAYRVQRPDQLKSVIERALDDPGTHREQRRRIAKDLFHRPGTATARAVRAFYDLLGLSRPDEADIPAVPATAEFHSTLEEGTSP